MMNYKMRVTFFRSLTRHARKIRAGVVAARAAETRLAQRISRAARAGKPNNLEFVNRRKGPVVLRLQSDSTRFFTIPICLRCQTIVEDVLQGDSDGTRLG